MQASHKISAVFDDPNLIGAAGLGPVVRLAERAGLHGLLEQHLSVASPNAALKAAGVIAGMLAGADSIDDLDVLRYGGMAKVFGGVRAPSTYGTFLRAFIFGHVRQLDAVAARALAGLATAAPRLLTGTEAMAFIDVDDTIRQVHGYAKQGAAYGYSGVKGVNAQIAALSSPICAPVIAAARLRKGNTVSGHGAARLIGDAISAARAAGVSGQVMVRADSGYYRQDVIAAAIKAKASFSVTARMDPAVKKAIAGIPERGWATIKYPRAVWDEQEHRWISEAQVAETTFTAFTSHPKKRHVPCQLVVRRAARLNPTAAAGQDELFTTWHHHAFITNNTLATVEADETHRDHAIIEQVIAELKDGPLAHAPSGRFQANAAWVALAAIAFTCSAPPEQPPRPGTPKPDGRPCAHNSSPSQPGSLPQHGASCCTCRPTGPGQRPGKTSGPPPPPPDHPAPKTPRKHPNVEEPDRPADHPCPKPKAAEIVRSNRRD